MNRIENTFETLKRKKQKAFGIFLTAGDPDFETSLKILEKLPQNRVDFIEIGMPFSDPMADGEAIQLSSQRALSSGMNLKKCLSLVKSFRKKDIDTPIILMGYYNPIYIYGKDKFIRGCLENGIDGLIIVDLPPEEDAELYNDAEANNISFIRLITPTTNEARLSKILLNATGFIYYISITGITGTKTPTIANVLTNLKKLKSFTNLPIIIGFGIRTPKQASSMSKISDGVVIGSAIVDLIKMSLNSNGKATDDTIDSCLKFITDVSDKIKNN